jgi:hypothetical protein
MSPDIVQSLEGCKEPDHRDQCCCRGPNKSRGRPLLGRLLPMSPHPRHPLPERRLGSDRTPLETTTDQPHQNLTRGRGAGSQAAPNPAQRRARRRPPHHRRAPETRTRDKPGGLNNPEDPLPPRTCDPRPEKTTPLLLPPLPGRVDHPRSCGTTPGRVDSLTCPQLGHLSRCEDPAGAVSMRFERFTTFWNARALGEFLRHNWERHLNEPRII